MTVVDRRVRSLRVRAPDSDRARHAAILLEDALRVASIPGTTGARVIAIRQLDLGRVPASASSISIALVVEAAAQRIVSSAVHAEQHGAASAPVVYFRDRGEVLATVVRRVLRAEPIDEWFWPLMLPSVATAPPIAVLASALEEARLVPAAMVVVAQTIASLVISDVSLPALAQLDASAALELSRVVGAQPSLVEAEAEGIASAEPRIVRAVARWVARWNARADDARVVWLATMLVVAEGRAMRAEARVAAMVAAVARAAVVLVAGAVEEGDAAMGDGKEMVAVGTDGWRSKARSVVDSQTGGAPRRPLATAPDAPPSPDSPFAETLLPSEPLWDTPRRTTHAGLLFAVPLLSRLGLDHLLAARPALAERRWPDALLLDLGRHLVPRDDDPAIDWLDPATLSLDLDDRPLTAEWIRALRARARGDARRSLRALAARPGAIAATRTHVDVFFLHKQVDIELRRTGLDFDPGWVAWLGRVVQFHYVDQLPVDDADA